MEEVLEELKALWHRADGPQSDRLYIQDLSASGRSVCGSRAEGSVRSLLILKGLDRLARSTRDLIDVLRVVAAHTRKEWSASSIHPMIERAVARNDTRMRQADIERRL
jgi:hypothetical protein